MVEVLPGILIIHVRNGSTVRLRGGWKKGARTSLIDRTQALPPAKECTNDRGCVLLFTSDMAFLILGGLLKSTETASAVSGDVRRRNGPCIRSGFAREIFTSAVIDHYLVR